MDDLLLELKSQILLGDTLIQNCRTHLSHVIGIGKFESRITAELKFLRPLLTNTSKLKPQHLVSSNLKSLEHIYRLALEEEDLLKIYYSVRVEDGEKVNIDLVSKGKWIKSCSRKPKALIQKWYDGDDVIIPLARKYIEASVLQHQFSPPKIFFHFNSGVPSKLANILSKMKITVIGDIIDFPEFEISDESSEDETEYYGSLCKESNIVNLDTCCLITLISNLSNGNANFKFYLPDNKFLIHLDQMAIDERSKRVLPDFIHFIKEKEWITAKSAYDEFNKIVSLIAGDQEKIRAQRIRERIRVVPDEPSQRILELPDSARISDRAKVSFGTGETHGAVTISSNTGFIRASRQKGIYVSVFEHRPRALSEKKESNATVIDEPLTNDFSVDYFSMLFE